MAHRLDPQDLMVSDLVGKQEELERDEEHQMKSKQIEQDEEQVDWQVVDGGGSSSPSPGNKLRWHILGSTRPPMNYLRWWIFPFYAWMKGISLILFIHLLFLLQTLSVHGRSFARQLQRVLNIFLSSSWCNSIGYCRIEHLYFKLIQILLDNVGSSIYTVGAAICALLDNYIHCWSMLLCIVGILWYMLLEQLFV